MGSQTRPRERPGNRSGLQPSDFHLNNGPGPMAQADMVAGGCPSIPSAHPTPEHHGATSYPPLLNKKIRPSAPWCVFIPTPPKRKTASLSANGASPYQPRATPWELTPPHTLRAEGPTHPPSDARIANFLFSPQVQDRNSHEFPYRRRKEPVPIRGTHHRSPRTSQPFGRAASPICLPSISL